MPPLVVLALYFSQADDAHGSPDLEAKPEYVAEAPLPKGWPRPGPYNKVTLKEFPAYRAAYTDSFSSGFAFWRLFRHIKRQDIPMTSPVEMGMKQKGGDKLGMKSMGFLYQNDEVGKLGNDGKKIEVRSVPNMRALSYTWQGDRNKVTMKKAKVAIDKAKQEKGLKSNDYRVMGYNGPGVADAKKTWEMLLVLPAKVKPDLAPKLAVPNP
ncbi:MAG: heme-binding protein [Akkermansiaceae bacterium]|nr:heme-binding protein [Akkermansiaceae bacterium]